MRSLPLCLLSVGPLCAQVDFNALKELKYRNIGPFRGGRAVAVAGVTSQPSTYYFGATGGGIWKTTDGGATWLPVSDGQFKTGSVGAMAVSESDPNVIYAGMGEACVRGNASNGDGVYKSIDAAKPGSTWASPTPTTSAASSSIPAIPTSFSSPRWAISSDPTTSAASTAPPTAAKPGRQLSIRDRDTGAVDLAMDPGQSQSDLCRLLGDPPQAVDLRKRRPRQRPVQIHRRRRHLDRDHPQRRPAQRRARPHRRHRFARQSRARVGHRGSRRRRRLSAPTTAATTGRRPTPITPCASAPGITRTSSPIPKAPRPSTSLNTGSGSPSTAATTSP